MNPFVPARLSRFYFPPFCVFLLIGMMSNALAQTPAFPGALGFGKIASGGRNGSVYHVTTLADSGPGSFRDAVSHSGRIVVFDVGGYIKLNTAVSCSGNLTIAGQTAPGGGIGFRGGEISFASRSNIICRYIRIRPGTETADPVNDDALSLYRARTVILDHCSFEFGPWNNVDAVSDDWQNVPVTDVTFQNCLNADPTGQQFGAHTESVSSTMAWIYSVFANSHNRNPLSKINDVFVNNVLYNCSAGYTTHTSTEFDHDIVNNYFIAGPAYGGSSDFPWFQVDNNQSIYYSGNLFDGNSDGALNGATTTPYWYQGGTGGTVLASAWSSQTATIPTFTPATAFRMNVSLVGALPRDQIDDLVISQMKKLGNGVTGTGAGTVGPGGGLYTSQAQTGLANNGYGVINGGVAQIDTDNDGMPDYWEKAVGLNPASASDTMTLGPDGYANIERYLNWLADPHVMTSTNAPVDIDLWQYTSGFTNASPVYSVTAVSNGVVVLNSGHLAHFTPPVNFFGLAAFQFGVTGSDGTGYTNNVTVVVSPIVPPSNLIWQGDGAVNLWGNGTGLNWLNGASLVTFNSGDNVTFDDNGSNAPAISLTGNLPAGIVYVLSDQDYTFAGSGAISGGAALFKTGNGRLTLNTTNTFVGGTMINDGVLQVGDGISCNGGLAGNVTNNDTLIFATPGTMTVAVSISGIGSLTKTGPGSLTLSGTQTYTAPTSIAAGALIFSGSVPRSDITNNGALTLAPSGSLAHTNVISGSGWVTTSASGVLALSATNTFAGNLTNAGGMLILSNSLAAGAGTVVYTGGYIVAAAGTFITNDFSVPNSTSDLSMMATNSGTATWAGNVTVGSGGQWRPGSDGGTLQFVGNAVMGTHIFLVPRGSVVFASNAVVSATVSGFLGRDGSGNKRSSNITIRDNASVSMAGCSFGGAKAGGSITVTLQNNGLLSFGANTVDLHSIANAAAVSTIRLNGGTLTVGGFTKTQSTYTNLINFNGGVLKAGAFNAAFLPAFSVASNAVQAGGAIIDDGGFQIAIGGLLLHDGSLGASLDGGLTKLGTGTLTLAANDTYTGPTIINAGSLVLYAPPLSSISNSASISIAAGAALDFALGGTGSMALGSGKTIFGNGVVKGKFTLGSGAILAAGSNAVGTLTFSNSLTLAAGSTNLFELSHAPLTNDSIIISGVLTNGGTLIATNIGGSQLAAGDMFKLFNAGGYAGSFSNVILPSLPVGLAWNTNSLNSAGTISVVLNTSPVFGSVSVSGDTLGFSGTGGVGNGFYILLGTTNLLTPFENWKPLLTNQFDNAGNFNFTTNADANTPQTFYRLQLQ